MQQFLTKTQREKIKLRWKVSQNFVVRIRVECRSRHSCIYLSHTTWVVWEATSYSWLKDCNCITIILCWTDQGRNSALIWFLVIYYTMKNKTFKTQRLLRIFKSISKFMVFFFFLLPILNQIKFNNSGRAIYMSRFVIKLEFNWLI